MSKVQKTKIMKTTKSLPIFIHYFIQAAVNEQLYKFFMIKNIIYLTIICWIFSTGMIHAQIQTKSAHNTFSTEASSSEHTPCISREERAKAMARAEENIIKYNIKLEKNAGMIVTYDWPIMQNPAFNYNSTYYINNFVDHNTGPGMSDYNCGNYTYDGHLGTDIVLWPFDHQQRENNQTWVVAAADGVIIAKNDGENDNNCNFNNPTANYIKLEHSDGSRSWYWHMKKNSLTNKVPGQSVARGDYLGVVASSGSSTNPHLHFECYDANNNLIDPYVGSCNSLNTTSYWTDARPYFDPAINAALTHTAPPQFPACPALEITNISTQFEPGDLVYFIGYFRDFQTGPSATFRIKRADGTLWQQPPPIGPFGPSRDRTSRWTHSYILPTNAPTGTWTFEIILNGETVVHEFNVGNIGQTELSFSSCPNNISVTATPGAGGANVTWATPTATTNCNSGGGGGGCTGSAISGFNYMGELNGSDYYVSQSSKKWIDAKTTCENNGGHLATISSQAENNFIFNNINNAVLIGISDEDKDGSLQWVTGESISYTNWNSINNQLNPNSGNLYGILNYWTPGGKWEITNYWTAKPFVMEIPCSGGGGGNSTPTITQIQGPPSGSFFSVGTTTVRYRATDNCGNVDDNCTFIVTVLENQQSQLSLNCPSNPTFTIPSGANGTTVNWTVPTASTSCSGGAMVTQTNGISNGNFLPIGNYVISYQATDNCGNMKNCQFTVIVESAPSGGSCNISLPNTCTPNLVCANLSGNVLSVNTNDNPFQIITIHKDNYAVHEPLCDFWAGGKPECTGTLTSSPLPFGNYRLKVPEVSGGICWIPFSVTSSRLTDEAMKLSIYPNPVRDVLHITLPENTIMQQNDLSKFIITNTPGQQVQTLPVSGEQVQILDVSDFAKGIYFIQLQSKDYKTQTAKFVVH